MRNREFFVYIMANVSRTLYTGVTSNVERRVFEHQHGLHRGFTSRYAIAMLVHVETFSDPESAIAREKQIKGWRRAKKIALIEAANPNWRDLTSDLVER